jgi:putative membrane protein
MDPDPIHDSIDHRTNRPAPPPPPDQLQLALERTFLAHERTLMAWIRTATSMITFGFTLYKFFYYLREEGGHPVAQRLGPRIFGLLMMGIGVFILAIATWQHHQQLKPLRARYHIRAVSLSTIVAALIALLGILGFFAALLRQ